MHAFRQGLPPFRRKLVSAAFDAVGSHDGTGAGDIARRNLAWNMAGRCAVPR